MRNTSSYQLMGHNYMGTMCLLLSILEIFNKSKEVFTAFLAILLIRISKLLLSISLATSLGKIQKSLLMNLETTTRNRLRRNMRPCLAAHIDFNGFQYFVHGTHLLSVHNKTLAFRFFSRIQCIGKGTSHTRIGS